MEDLKQRIPDHARDLRINLGVITQLTTLSPEQAWQIALASAISARNPETVRAIEAAAPLDDAQRAAARGAAAIMGMNNVYYRFVHMMGDAPKMDGGGFTPPPGNEYGAMPARLRMQIIGNPGIPRLDFELACLASSAITGCEACVRSHEESARRNGATREMVQDAVRIAAVIHGVAVALPV
jgi:alkyl hydroperoxide reductase subunit D